MQSSSITACVLYIGTMMHVSQPVHAWLQAAYN